MNISKRNSLLTIEHKLRAPGLGVVGFTFFGILFLCLMAIGAQAAQIEWEGLNPGAGDFSGDYEANGNWVGSIAPVAGDDAIFNINETFTVDFSESATVQTLFARRGVEVTFDLSGNTFQANSTSDPSFVLGSDSLDSATFLLKNGTFNAAGDVEIGSAPGSSGVLRFFEGLTHEFSVAGDFIIGKEGTGDVLFNDGINPASLDVILGDLASGQGAVEVSGAGTTWNLQSTTVGRNGRGDLAIGDGAMVSSLSGNTIVGENSNSDGTVAVDNGTWNLNDLVVGNDGVGVVSISNGGTVASPGVPTFGAGLGHGTLTIDGAGSSFTSSDSAIEVGDQGTGVINLSNGGTLNVFTGDAGKTLLGSQSSGDGTVILTGSGTQWNNSADDSDIRGALDVGASGTGRVDILDGAQLTSGMAVIGRDPGSNGTVNLNGIGSTWDLNNDDFFVGEFGTGALNLSNGSEIQWPEFVTEMFLGHQELSNGTIDVDGAGTKLLCENVDNLFIGGSGDGVLNIQNGGFGNAFLTVVGQTVTGDGEVNVSGAGSIWEVLDDLFVGEAGAGQVNVTAGGKLVVVATFKLGVEESSMGTLSIDGNGSIADTVGITIGDDGTGVLNITGGAELDASGLDLGSSSTGHGTATINNGILGVSSIDVGLSGTGVVNVENGSTITASSTSVIGKKSGTGTMTLSGGSTLAMPDDKLIIGDEGTGTLELESGSSISANEMAIGEEAGAEGTVTFDSGASYSDTKADSKPLLIGNGGIGTLNILNGSEFRSDSLAPSRIGNQDGGSGTLYVSGSGSLFKDSASQIQVPLPGATTATGLIHLRGGGRAECTSIAIGDNGTVRFTGTSSGGDNPFGQLVLEEDYDLGGKVEIVFEDDFFPGFDRKFVVIQPAEGFEDTVVRSNDFSSRTVPIFSGGIQVVARTSGNEYTVEVRAPSNMTYTGWRGALFSSEDISGGLAVSTADPDGDNLANLAEFAFGMGPKDPNLGEIEFSLIDGKPQFRFPFIRNKLSASHNIQVRMQKTNDIGNPDGWEVITNSTLQPVPGDSPYFTLMGNDPVGSDVEIYRLVVTGSGI